MLSELLFVLWFFIPAGFANVVPILVAKLRWFEEWNRPLDFGKKFRKKRILGDHKTWRGLICGVVGGTALAMSPALFLTDFSFFHSYAWMLYGVFGLYGFLLSLGALTGDAVKSFVKRQLHIPAGKPLLVFDQIDYILGAIVFTAWLVPYTWKSVLLALGLWGGMSLVSSYIGYLLKFKKSAI